CAKVSYGGNLSW
nr:immunoglobulin heavy chain junction region [Macaca mulatta]